MSRSSIDGGQIGKIVNLLSNDLRLLDDVNILIFDIWRGPLEATAFLIAIYMEIGSSVFIGMGFLACFIPFKSKHTFRFINMNINYFWVF